MHVASRRAIRSTQPEPKRAPSPESYRSICISEIRNALGAGRAHALKSPPHGLARANVLGRAGGPDNTWTYYELNGRLFASHCTKSGTQFFAAGFAPVF